MRTSVWIEVRSKRFGITGYIEMFLNRVGDAFTVPGASRWIDGAEFDLSKARPIRE